MLGILYLIAACIAGYGLLKITMPGIFSAVPIRSLSGKPVKLDSWMIALPASFLTGTLILTWVAYFGSYAFRYAQKPLIYGNLTAAVAFSAILACTRVKSGKNKKRDAGKNIYGRFAWFIRKNAYGRFAGFMREHAAEMLFLVIIAGVWSYLMFRTFYIKNGTMYISYSVFSDFAPHLAVIRSFSYGSNFPTEYPHFADGTMRYHFMFQFLAGNLEFLGLRLDWAFNLPSILSIVSFLMLLYSLAVIITGERRVGILAAVLFFFRSSFAFFTFISGMKNVKEIFMRILANDLHIGKTLHEEWGLWAQKVYVNQRHLPFAMGILIFIIIAVLPLFRKMLFSLKKANATAEKGLKSAYLRLWDKEFILKPDAWLPGDVARSAVLGIILGLISFWNGAVMIASLSILFVMAIISKHRLEFVNIAVCAAIPAFLQSMFFIGPGKPAIEPKLTIGFLSGSGEITGILKYYAELLGIFPVVLFASLLFAFKRWRRILTVVLVPPAIFYLVKLSPEIEMGYKLLAGMSILLLLLAISDHDLATAPESSVWLTPAFFAPIVLATVLQLTPDITVNHKYVIISVILLNIFVASLLHNLFSSRKNAAVAAAVVLSAFLTVTGMVDIITLHNLDKRHIEVKTKDELLVWAANNTGPNEIFLTDMYSIHPILLAGRKIFYGWPYYPWSAGYDTYGREAVVKEIYGGGDIGRVKELIEKYGLSYIVVEDSNRNSKSYSLNEQLIKENFKLVYERGGLAVYRTY